VNGRSATARLDPDREWPGCNRREFGCTGRWRSNILFGAHVAVRSNRRLRKRELSRGLTFQTACQPSCRRLTVEFRPNSRMAGRETPRTMAQDSGGVAIRACQVHLAALSSRPICFGQEQRYCSVLWGLVSLFPDDLPSLRKR
jgi:hypothetical protein